MSLDSADRTERAQIAGPALLKLRADGCYALSFSQVASQRRPLLADEAGALCVVLSMGSRYLIFPHSDDHVRVRAVHAEKEGEP